MALASPFALSHEGVSKRTRWCDAALLLALSCSMVANAQDTLDSGNEVVRPVPDLRPEAVGDAATAEPDKPLRIDVLANDIGMPPDPQIRLEGDPPVCGRADLEGRVIVYTATPACVGQTVTFGYSVAIADDRVAALVSVTVKAPGPSTSRPNVPSVAAAPPATVPPPPVAPATAAANPPAGLRPEAAGATTAAAPGTCNVPGIAGSATSVAGGVFRKNDAPAGIADIVGLVDDAEFTVSPFCITIAPAPAAAVDAFLAGLGSARATQFPERGSADGSDRGLGRAGGSADADGHDAARVSQRLAAAFAKGASERNGQAITVPTLEQYVAAAWELQKIRPDSPAAQAFMSTLRTGDLQWTSTPCGTGGNFLAIGPGRQGSLVKLCYEQSRLDRTGFRLAAK